MTERRGGVPEPAAKRPRSAPLFARTWNLLARRVLDDATRREILAPARGAVLEIGAGNGANLAHYPPGVASVVAVEPEPWLRGRAERAAVAAARPVRVVDGTAEAIDAPDDSFDTAVCCLVLCSVPDQDAALAEIRRVLRPDGRLLVYEHVLAGGWRGRVQRGLDRSGLWPRLGAGCRLSRDTAAALSRAGFATASLHRVEVGLGAATVPHLVGATREVRP